MSIKHLTPRSETEVKEYLKQLSLAELIQRIRTMIPSDETEKEELCKRLKIKDIRLCRINFKAIENLILSGFCIRTFDYFDVRCYIDKNYNLENLEQKLTEEKIPYTISEDLKYNKYIREIHINFYL